MKRNGLIILFSSVLLVSSYTIVSTSIQSNLFTLMANWGQDQIDPYPWFEATLWDFYCNFIVIALLVWHKERGMLKRLTFIIGLAALGSPGTALYLLIHSLRLKKDEGLSHLFQSNR